MKTSIHNLEDALALELQLLFDGERLLTERLSPLANHVYDSDLIKSILERYAESAWHKKTKIERMFSYLPGEPLQNKEQIMDDLLEEIKERIKQVCTNQASQFLILNTLNVINQYKITRYKAAQRIALKLEREVVADLLSQILEWEISISHELAQDNLRLYYNSSSIS